MPSNALGVATYGSPLKGVSQTYAEKVLALGPFAYWILNEAAGPVAADSSGNGYNGTYVATTLGQPGIGDGNTCPFFDGTNDAVNIYSAALSAAFNPVAALGSALAWAKVNAAAVWSDGVTRYVLALLDLTFNTAIYIRKSNAPINQLRGIYDYAGAGLAAANYLTTTTGWFAIALTWSVAASELKLYFGGTQQGGTQALPAGWGNGLHANNTLIGANNIAPLGPWHGWIAHVSLWNKVLTQPEIASLSAV